MICRHRPLLPDRPLLPRRGPARRPAAGVHAGRRRDVVRAPRTDLRTDRAADAAADLQLIGREVTTPFRRMPYAEAIATYGSDKPDLRCRHGDPAICPTAFRDSEFRVFKQIVADGGVVRGFAVKGGNKYSRSQLDELVDQAKQLGFTGLIWVRPGEPPLRARVQGARRRRAPAGARRSPARRGRPAADGGRASRADLEAARPAAAARSRRRRTCSIPTGSSSSGSSTFRCSNSTTRRQRW